MKIIIKKDLINFYGKTSKAGEIIELDKLSFQEKSFWKNRLQDGKIDGFVEEYIEPAKITSVIKKNKGDR